MNHVSSILCPDRGWRGTFAVLLLSSSLMLVSLGVQYPSDPFACFGRMGRGWPVSWVCDYSGGGSPLSSLDRIDLGDLPIVSLSGMWMDFLFYLGLFWLSGRVLIGVYQVIHGRRHGSTY